MPAPASRPNAKTAAPIITLETDTPLGRGFTMPARITRGGALHRRGTVSEAMMYAFDLLELDGEDLRGLPLGDRKKRLTRLVGKRRVGIVLSDHTVEDGTMLFLQACKLGLEGIVSKRLSAPYRSGPSRD
jgi:ATP-dependent DNA ligase